MQCCSGVTNGNSVCCCHRGKPTRRWRLQNDGEVNYESARPRGILLANVFRPAGCSVGLGFLTLCLASLVHGSFSGWTSFHQTTNANTFISFIFKHIFLRYQILAGLCSCTRRCEFFEIKLEIQILT